MSQEKYEIVKFVDDGLELNVSISPNDDTVWLTQEQIANLFSRDKSVISRHIKNIFLNDELQENSCVAFFATELNKYDPRTKKNRITVVDVKYFNLDVILAVGYKVKTHCSRTTELECNFKYIIHNIFTKINVRMNTKESVLFFTQKKYK